MDIVSREQWHARYANGSGPAPLPAEYLFLHHTTTAKTASIRAIEDIGESRFGRGISYTFVIRDDGTVYEGHGIDRKGTHTKGLNSRARSICCVGNYQTDEPSDALLTSIVDLVVHGHRKGWWPARITGGHRDAPEASTACPGDRLHRRIPELNALIAEHLNGDDMPWTDADSENLRAVRAALESINHQIAGDGTRLARVVRAVEALREKLAPAKKS